MSGAWGVASNEAVQRVWLVAPGVEGATVEGFTVRLPATGVVPNAQHIGYRISGGHPLRVHQGTDLERVNGAFEAMDEQFREWANSLLAFGSDVSTTGIRYLAAGYQSCKIVLADVSTYDHALARTIFLNAALGAADITSPQDFVASAYARRNAAAPTTAILWINKTTGARVNLSDVVHYGTLVDEPPFTRPTSMRS